MTRRSARRSEGPCRRYRRAGRKAPRGKLRRRTSGGRRNRRGQMSRQFRRPRGRCGCGRGCKLTAAVAFDYGRTRGDRICRNVGGPSEVPAAGKGARWQEKPASRPRPYAQGTGPQEGKKTDMRPNPTEAAAHRSRGPRGSWPRTSPTPEARRLNRTPQVENRENPPLFGKSRGKGPRGSEDKQPYLGNPSTSDDRIRKLPTHPCLRPRRGDGHNAAAEPVTVVLTASRSETGPSRAGWWSKAKTIITDSD